MRGGERKNARKRPPPLSPPRAGLMASPSASAPASLSSHPVEAALIWGAALVPLVLLAHSLLPRRRIQSGKTSWRHARLVKAAVPLMGRSPSLPPPSAPPKPVDLTGYWLNTEIRGDFRAYMVSMGAPFLVRSRLIGCASGGRGMCPQLCARCISRANSSSGSFIPFCWWQVQQAAKDQDYGVGKMRNVISNQTRWHLSLETNFPFVHSIDLECAPQDCPGGLLHACVPSACCRTQCHQHFRVH